MNKIQDLPDVELYSSGTGVFAACMHLGEFGDDVHSKRLQNFERPPPLSRSSPQAEFALGLCILG